MTRAEKRRAARQQEKEKVRYQLTAEEIRQIEKKAVESKKEQIRDKIMQEVKEEWKPYPLNKEENKNSRILKFSREVIKETNDIFADENADIRNYVEEVYQKYGVKYHMEDA